MFTGLIQEVGLVKKAVQQGPGLELFVESNGLSHKVKVGDSVAVNGCCLTAVGVNPPLLSFQAVSETLNRTVLGDLKPGAKVNLELPLTLSDPLGGHFVQGHVDGTAEIIEITPDGAGARLKVKIPELLARYVVEKGSLALDGISLTVAAVQGNQVEVALISHTLQSTSLRDKKAGDFLHLEVDMLAKYIEKLSSAYFQAEKK
jgi:riboflavin synthase